MRTVRLATARTAGSRRVLGDRHRENSYFRRPALVKRDTHPRDVRGHFGVGSGVVAEQSEGVGQKQIIQFVLDPTEHTPSVQRTSTAKQPSVKCQDVTPFQTLCVTVQVRVRCWVVGLSLSSNPLSQPLLA